MMMINKKKRFCIYAAILIGVAGIAFYLTGRRTKRHDIGLQTFRAGDGWGYEVLVDGRVMIHQPTVPTLDTIMNFPTEEMARHIGTLVVNRMTERKDFSVTRDEIEHSLSYLGQ